MRKMSFFLGCILFGVILVICTFLLLNCCALTVRAAPVESTWYVETTGNDENDCLSELTACRTLGGAISKASGDDTIRMGTGIFTGTYSIYKNLTIVGAGRESTILDGNREGRVWSSTQDLTLEDLTIRNGLTSDIFGGGIYNYGMLTLSNTLIISNSSGLGGGINNRGSVLLINSTVTGNHADGEGGGIYNYSSAVLTVTNSLIAGNDGNNGGGISNYFGGVVLLDSTIGDNSSISSAGGIYSIGGTAVLSATTVHSNETDGTGGGIYISQAVFTITNTTISSNSSVTAGGIYVQGDSKLTILNSTIANNQKVSAGGAGGISNSPTGIIDLKNSILANNDGYQCAGSGGWNSYGHNLSSDTRCQFFETGDLVGTDPLLAPLADYGGSTWTHALMPGGPAIDAGDNNGCPAADQRGVSRPVDGDNSGAAVCDMGSYEARNQITIDDVSISEGDVGPTYAVFTVTLAPTSTQAISVDYTTAGGTAVSNGDFDAAGGKITFEPYQATRFITVTVNGDTDDESDEMFFVNITNPQVADLVDGQAVGTIIDDDGLPALTISDRTVDEGNSGAVNAVFQVSLSPVSAVEVTVEYTTTNGTAFAGSDYAAISGMLAFATGEATKYITVTVYGDRIDEGESEFFTVDLGNVVNANLSDGKGVGVITDDDLAKLSIGGGPVVKEGDVGVTPAVFTVTLSTPTSFTVTVDYATRDGYQSAVAGSDYEAISGTLTFEPGEKMQNILVNVIGDTVNEPDEDFDITLSNPNPVNFEANNSSAIIINDDFDVYLPLVMRQ